MGKKKSTWVSPKKQLELDREKARVNRRNFVIGIIVCVLLVCSIAAIIFGIVMACRPYYAFIEIEGYGTVVIELNDSEAPKTVDAFVELAGSGHYDGTSIHSALKNNYIMGGNKPNATTDKIVGEFTKNGYENTIPIVRGSIVMARVIGTDADGNPSAADMRTADTANGEFFIMLRDKVTWEGYYAAFGTVIEGMDIVDLICEKAVANEDGDILEKQPVIKTIRIERSYN